MLNFLCITWTLQSLRSIKLKYRIDLAPRGCNEENAAKEGMSLNEFIWKNKEDWYDLDFLYLEQHPDFRAFNLYENSGDITNVFMEAFPADAFENRRGYICFSYQKGT